MLQGPAIVRHCLSLTLCACVGIGLGAVPAPVGAQPSAPFDPAPIAQPPMRLSLPPPPVLRAPEALAPPLRAEAFPAPSGMPGADTPALQAELERLRATALSAPGTGARAGRAQGQAAWVLGLLSLHGIGMAASPADAASWFERARRLGEPLAAAGLAWCEIDGCQGPPNPAAARRWIAPLRAVNLPRAQYLQWLVESRLAPLRLATPGLRPEASTAGPLPGRQLLISAAQGGDIQARIELGLESAAANRLAEALGHFRAAAARSPAAAANAALLSERLGRTPDIRPPPAAAASPGNDNLALARRNHRGEGQPANFTEAIRLYRLAQGQGSEQARKMLGLIFSRPGPDGQLDIGWMQQLAYVNLSGEAVTLGSPATQQMLRREPTPLADLLPPPWRQYASGLVR